MGRSHYDVDLKFSNLTKHNMNLVERIARHADIDTRRALGFGPHRLPPSDLNIKLNFVPHGCGRKIHLGDALSLTVHPRGGISWVFGGPRLTTVTEYFFESDGRLRVWTLCRCETSLHPDFNEDGSFKRAEPSP
jgi:hypothetical protein